MITKIPIVGKYVIEEPFLTDGFIGHAWGMITRISGKRIYYDRVICWNEELQSYETVEEWIYNFSAICDTTDEVNELKNYSKTARKEISQLREKFESTFKNYFSK